MKKIFLTLVSLACFAAASATVAAEMPTTDAPYENGQLESFGCCGLPQ